MLMLYCTNYADPLVVNGIKIKLHAIYDFFRIFSWCNIRK